MQNNKNTLKVCDLILGKLYVFNNHPLCIFKNMNVGNYDIIGTLKEFEPFLLLSLAEVINDDRYFSCRILTKNGITGWIAVSANELQFAKPTI